MSGFVLVDSLINYPEDKEFTFRYVLSERRHGYYHWSDLPSLEEKVLEWTKEHPVIWNVGIGPAASFVPTLSRLLFERTKELYLYGPDDHITPVRLSRPAHHHLLAFDVMAQLARTLKIPLPDDIKQLAAEESYFGYGKLSDYLMLRAFGRQYIDLFAPEKPVRLDPIYDSEVVAPDESIQRDPSYKRQPERSPVLTRVQEVYGGNNRHLLLVENLHFPVSLDVLTFMINKRPSTVQQNRWLISTTCKDVCNKSREAEGALDRSIYHLTPEYYHVPTFHDLRGRDWAMLIKEALLDAARSICFALQDKGYPLEFWVHVAQKCLYYGILYHHPLQQQRQGAGGRQASSISSVTSDELVRCWVAEDLIFSAASATKIPAAIGKRRRNDYRSAYEAGKAVMQTLQEYSLLPVYSAVSQDDAVTGVSMLAEDIPRLSHEVLNIRLKKSNIYEWVSFMNGHGRHVSWDWGPRPNREDVMMTTLILRGCSNISGFPLDKLLTPHLHVLDLSYTPINSLPPSFSFLLNLYMLSLRGCSQLQTLSQPPPPNSDKNKSSPLAHLENLEVLDMNGVPLLELTKPDGSNKSNLHYLDLSGSKFTTLHPEFFCEMSSLEELILGNCTNLKELPPSMAQLSNLLVLHVEGTQITSFPELMFQKMQVLNTLKLINNVLLMSLPVSLSEASCLEVLHLHNCIRLKSILRSTSKARGIKELHISNCISLSLWPLWEQLPSLEKLYIQAWVALEDIKILGHPSLRIFSLSGPRVRCLSLHGCSKLKIVNFSDDVTALEDVDLSGTDLDEVPHNLPNLPQLRMLLLLGVPYSMRFPWHQLVRFPKIFYLHHCADVDSHFLKKLCAAGNHQEREKTTNTAQININDPRMFHSFNADTASKLVKERQFLKSFNVQVQPCSVSGKKPQNNEIESSTRIQTHYSTYPDVQYSTVDSIMPMKKLQPMRRHVEISAVNQYPNGLRHILSVTESIFITDDNVVRCLTDLNYSLNDLKECQLQRCHQMTVVFLMRSQGSELNFNEALPNLQILQVLDLNNLLSLVEHSRVSYFTLVTLKLLKHIHLEHCPRLENMFPWCLSLPALETLVILFCSNLKTIFYKHPDLEVTSYPLPSIKRIYLQELPQLLHIHDDVTFRFWTPKWEKLFVRGCQSFHHLPLLKIQPPTPLEKFEMVKKMQPLPEFVLKLGYLKSKVEVSGEREWWDRLHLKLPEQSDYYLHVPPPEFVSRKKHIIESYLR